MIKETNLHELYDIVIETNEITTKKLNELGFNSTDITNLLKKGWLIRVQRGIYQFNSAKEIFVYGEKLTVQKEHEKAQKCFSLCYSLEPNNIYVIFQLLLLNIKSENYYEAFEYLKKLYTLNKPDLTKDLNFYLYLLNMIIDLPEEYREQVKSFKISDIREIGTDALTLLEEKLRLSAYKQSWALSLKNQNILINARGKYSGQDIIIKSLLKKILSIKKRERIQLIELTKNHNYEGIIAYIHKLEEKSHISLTEKSFLNLTNTILDITKTNKIPIKEPLTELKLFEAIKTNNYDKALEIMLANAAKYGFDYKENPNYYLLNDIINKIKEIEIIKKEEQIKKENNEADFKLIFQYLMSNNLPKCYEVLKKYLNSNKKEEYYFLIDDLLKISILDNDKAFTKPMLVLSLLADKDYTFDISPYIKEFYLNLSQNNWEKARLYLDIISNANKLGQECILTDSLYQILETSANIVKDKQEELEILKVEPLKEDIERKLVEEKHQKLQNNKGIILLEPMNQEATKKIINLVQNYSDMEAFTIDDNGKARVVLKYQLANPNYLNIKELTQEGKEAYDNHNYDKCLANNLKILSIYSRPYSINFYVIGMCYIKKQEKQLGIDYLTVANSLAKAENKGIDYSHILEALTNPYDNNHNKPFFRMREKDFQEKNVINNFNEINDYIISSGLDVETACQNLGFSEEQIDLIKLQYAKELYKTSNFERGDLFVKAVEKRTNKTKRVKNQLLEVIKNKKLYPNRLTEETQGVSLVLLPNKK